MLKFNYNISHVELIVISLAFIFIGGSLTLTFLLPLPIFLSIGCISGIVSIILMRHKLKSKLTLAELFIMMVFLWMIIVSFYILVLILDKLELVYIHEDKEM